MTTVTGRLWTMHLGSAEIVLTGSLVERVLQRTSRGVRVLTDPPYGTRSYATDVDDGLVVRVLRSLGAAETIAVFGYPEVLFGWCRSLMWRHVDEWVTWWPSNAASKAGGRAKKLPAQSECIAIVGDIPGATRLTYPRSAASAKKPQNRHLSPDARLGDVWTDPSPGIGFNAAKRRHPNDAVRLGRRFIGIEKDPKYFATAVARLKEVA